MIFLAQSPADGSCAGVLTLVESPKDAITVTGQIRSKLTTPSEAVQRSTPEDDMRRHNLFRCWEF
jgi:hypothetical protein